MANSPADPPLYATVRELARILGVGEKRVRRAVVEGEIPSAQISGWRRVRVADGVRWAEGHFDRPDDSDRAWLAER